ncbi:MAG: cytochrome C554 and C-prime [Calditrichaeota bacterium]|nr:MAG: cytochrome C554 and C-prime [Calditrichota bacterium]
MRLKIYKLAGCFLAVALLFQCSYKNESQHVPLEERFDKNKHGYAFAIPNLQPVAEVHGIQAINCSACHLEIYQEWQASTHAAALRDIQFQAELSKADSPKWLCLNCHIPVQNQRDSIVTHLRDNDVLQPVSHANPQFDPQFQQEAISCAACHIRRDEETGASYIIGAIGSPFAPHPVRKDKEFLRQICLRCHDPQGERLTQNLLCWFDSSKELDEGQIHLREKFGTSKDCVDCHMPVKRRRLTVTYPDLPERDSHLHHWVGGGVPKSFSDYDGLLERGFTSGLEIKVHPILKRRPDRQIEIIIDFTNVSSGHYLPTADPERFLLAKVLLFDSGGTLLQEKEYRIGQKWLWNPARKVGDNRLKQGETRTWKTTLQVPENVTGDQLSVRVYNVRLSSENANYMMQATNVNENFLPNGQALVNNAIDHYPFASFIYREDINLKNMQNKVFSPQELIDLSKAEKGKSLADRDY